MGQLIVIIAMLALLWLLLIRPARRRQTAQQELLAGVEVDDEILTAGGVYGRVREINSDELLVEVAPGVELRMARRAVAAVIPPDADDGDEQAGDGLDDEVLDGEVIDDDSASRPEANGGNRG